MIDAKKLTSVLIRYISADTPHHGYSLTHLSQMLNNETIIEIETLDEVNIKVLLKTKPENIKYFDEKKKYLIHTLTKLLKDNFDKQYELSTFSILALDQEELLKNEEQPYQAKNQPSPPYGSIIAGTLLFSLVIWISTGSFLFGVLMSIVHPFIARLVSGILHTICEQIDEVYELAEKNKIGIWTRNNKMVFGAWWPITIIGIPLGIILIIFGRLYKMLF